MKNCFLFLFTTLFLLLSCQQAGPKLQEELSQAQTLLQEKEIELELLRAGHRMGELEHIVFLKVKERLSEEELDQLITEIKKLGKLEMVKHLEVGKIADTGDERFISDHDIVFQMAFSSMEDYVAYSNHPTHLKIREILASYLVGPPAVYDYWRE